MLLTGSRSRFLLDPRLLAPDGSSGGSLPADDSDIDKMDDLGDAGKDALKKERQARRDAAKAEKEAKDQLKTLSDQVKTLTDEKAKRDADAAAQAESDREKKGEFESLAKDRERERDQAKEDLKKVQADFDALKSASLGMYKSDFDTLPQEVKDMFTGAEDDPVALMAFLPKAKKAAEKFGTGEQKKTEDPIGGGNPANPESKPTTTQTKSDDEAREQFRRSYA